MADWVGYAISVGFGGLAGNMFRAWWDARNRERLELTWDVTTTLVMEATDAELTVTYEGKPVKKLHSHSLTIRNTGNKALTSVPITTQTDGKVVKFSLGDRPKGEIPTLAQPDDYSFEMTFPVLNAGERVVFGVTATDSTAGTAEVVARAPNLNLRHRKLETGAPPFPNRLIALNRLIVYASLALGVLWFSWLARHEESTTTILAIIGMVIAFSAILAALLAVYQEQNV